MIRNSTECGQCGKPFEEGDGGMVPYEAADMAHSNPYICISYLSSCLEAAERREVDLREELIEVISEAVQQECALPGRPGVFGHSFIATYEGWIEYLVARGVMRLIATPGVEYEFVDAPAGSDVWPGARVK